MVKDFLNVAVVSFLMLFCPCFALAQANTATILGTVTDPNGAGVAGVRVTAKNEEKGFIRTVTSSSDGSYLISMLPIGNQYAVSAEAAGFKLFVKTGLVLVINQNARVDVSLEIGEISDTVTVEADVPMVNTYTVERGEVVGTELLQDLPLNGRNPLQLATLVPGVTVSSVRVTLDGGNRQASYVSVNGSRLNETDYQLNGIRFAGSYTNSGLNYPNPDALQEFKLITNPNSAEYGVWSGAVFSAETKSGTNEFHGSAWEFLRNDKLNARNFFAAKKPTLRQNQFGATAGGPIVKNKAFWFFSYQGLRIRQQVLASSVPFTAAERQGLITSPTAVSDPQTGQPFPQNAQGQYVIPQQRFNPVSRRLLEDYIPVAPPGGVIQTVGARAVDVDQYASKVDFNFSQKDQLGVSLLFDKTKPNNPFFMGPYTSYGGRTAQAQDVYVLSLSQTHTFGPRLFNNFRFGISGEEENRLPVGQAQPDELGLQNWNYNFLSQESYQAPTISVAGRFTLGSFGFSRWREGGQNWQITDTLSYEKGNHQLRFGMDLYRRKHFLDANVCDTGCFFFNGFGGTGNVTSDFLLGELGGLLRVRYLNHPGYKSLSKMFFIQDNWRIHPRLTLNLGLRYEIHDPFEEYRAREDRELNWNTHGGLPIGGNSTFRLGARSTVFPLAPAGLAYVGDITPEFPDGVPEGIIRRAHKFLPRLGLVWDPFGDGKTAVRASAGLFTNAQFVDLPAQVSQNLPFIVVQFAVPPGTINDPYAGLLRFPEPTAQNLQNDPRFFAPFLPAAAYGWSPDFELPRIVSLAFDVERQLTRSLAVNVGYFGKLSRHLPLTRDINTAIYNPNLTVQQNAANPNARRRLAPGVFQKINIEESVGNASFQSLQMSARYRFANRLNLMSAYTWSHSLDTWSTIDVQSIGAIQDPQDIRGSRGDSDFDRRHFFSTSFSYDVPDVFKGGSRPLSHVFGNWQVSAIVLALSGLPFTVFTGADFTFTAANADRPDLIGDPRFSGSRSRGDVINSYLNRAAFRLNMPGRYGNVGRNTFRAPGYFNTDLALLKNIKFNERHQIQLRAEFFNVFNQVHLNSPINQLTSPAFGRIVSTAEPRLVQLGIKYYW